MGDPTTPPGDMGFYFDWAKSVERLDEEFPEERVREMDAMVAQVAPYQSWYSRSFRGLSDYVHEPKRQRCQYCRQVSGNDARGGCVACGGPRAEYKPGPIEETLVNWRI